MWVEIGHTAGLDLPSGQGHLVALPSASELTTRFNIPADVPLADALASVLDALPYHIQDGHIPAWIKSDNSDLQSLLLKHFDIPAKKNTRPTKWGQRSMKP